MIRRKKVDSSADGVMEDVNEQELARVTRERQFFGESGEDGDGAEEPTSSSFSSVEAEGEAPTEEGESKSLPVIVPEAAQLTQAPLINEENEEKNEEENIDGEAEVDNEPPFEDGTGEEKSEPKRERRGRGYVAVIAICLALSLALSFGAFNDKRGVGEPSVYTEAELDEDETRVETTKSDGEALSAQSIYEKRKTASVTVTAIKGEERTYFSGTSVFGGGYVATVSRGVADADRVEITLTDGRTFAAAVIGADDTVDLALLKSDATELGGIEALGTTFDTGKRLYAIGTAKAAQFGGSLFEGVVAFGERTVELDGGAAPRRATAIQIGGFYDSALRGSPVYDESGAAVAMVWSSEKDSAVALALPIERVMAVMEFFIDGQTPSREVLKAIAYTSPSLGIVGQNATADELCGVLITDFTDASCDAAVKLCRGDLIFKIGDTVTADTAAVKEAVYTFSEGDKVEVFVLRDGQRLSFFVELTCFS